MFADSSVVAPLLHLYVWVACLTALILFLFISSWKELFSDRNDHLPVSLVPFGTVFVAVGIFDSSY